VIAGIASEPAGAFPASVIAGIASEPAGAFPASVIAGIATEPAGAFPASVIAGIAIGPAGVAPATVIAGIGSGAAGVLAARTAWPADAKATAAPAATMCANALRKREGRFIPEEVTLHAPDLRTNRARCDVAGLRWCGGVLRRRDGDSERP